jgi:hypothetical protein
VAGWAAPGAGDHLDLVADSGPLFRGLSRAREASQMFARAVRTLRVPKSLITAMMAHVQRMHPAYARTSRARKGPR